MEKLSTPSDTERGSSENSETTTLTNGDLESDSGKGLNS